MKIVAILNQNAKNGSEERIITVLKEKLGHHLFRLEQTNDPQQATAIAREAVKQDVDTIIAIGGDGTINAIVNGIVGTRIALGLIPCGTANDLASLHKIPNDIADACDVILGRRLKNIDAISINDYYYVTNGGIGFCASVAEIANNMRHGSKTGKFLGKLFGSLFYMLATVVTLIRDKKNIHRITVYANGHSQTVDTSLLMINNQFRLGKNFLISPGAVNDDGLFDVCLVEKRNTRWHLFRLVVEVLRCKHIQSPDVQMWRASEISIHADEPVSYLADGEVFPKESDFTIRLLSKALKLIVPDDASLFSTTRDYAWRIA